MPKKVKTVIKLQIPAGKANPAPPVGPALGQHGLNISEFCSKFNAATQKMGDDIIPIEVLFRTLEEMPELEVCAINKARGRVLDVGAGAGSIAVENEDGDDNDDNAQHGEDDDN